MFGVNFIPINMLSNADTTSAIDLFGKTLDDKECLGFFDFKTVSLEKRISGELNGNIPGFEYPIVGFINNN